MLNKIVQKKKTILIGCIAILLILWTLTLIYGNSEDKIMILILSLILPLVVYGFGRLMFKVVRITAPLKFIKFGIYFFLIFSMFSLVTGMAYFITDFPNGFSPVLTAFLGMIVAMLDEAKKNIDIEEK